MIDQSPAAGGTGGALYFDRLMFVHRGLITPAVDRLDGARKVAMAADCSRRPS